MSIAITEEHVALAATVRRYLDSRCPPSVARADLDSEAERLPEFWAEIAALGWLGLHIDEAHGGGGYGLSELAVVVEEAGRAAVPGPLLATVLASTLVAHGGSAEVRRALLPALASGSQIGAVGFPTTSALNGWPAGPNIRVSGQARPVLSGALADWLVLPVTALDGDYWCVIPASAARITPRPSLDPTRRVANVEIEGFEIDPDHRLTLDRQQVDDLIAAVVAAECAGGSGWCLDTATDYAKVREQFGRPIGQFQAVKHRCADMLIATEQVRAAAWDAAAALDGGSSPEASLAAAAAGAIGPEAYFRASKDCVQVLGGIGFTWEHEAHRHLRRALSLRQLLGGTTPWRQRVAEEALLGTRRGVAMTLPPEDDEARARVREAAEQIAARPKEERREALVHAGLFVPHWPEPWGRGAGPMEQLVIDEELSRVRVRRANMAVGAWAAPTIAAHGTPAQQERWVLPTLLGHIRWCQLFSEPGAGSDLASLATRAVRVEGGWSITGQKVWTSMAGEAEWGICLARTNPAAPKHLGITYFIVDMTSPGIEIRPLRELTGHAMFNEVFLTDLFVPDDCVIGDVDGGWPLARTTLANERVAMGSGASFGGGMLGLLDLVTEIGDLDPVATDQLGALLAESHTLALLGQRATLRAVVGGSPGPESSVRKLLGAEHDQRTQEFGLTLLGAEGATTEGPAAQWSFGFLANRCLTIAGGTSEVQRNVIAERLLGLPRDPEPVT